LDATLELYRKIVSLTPDELDQHSAATAKVNISGQTVYLNGPFWDLVRGWIRVYYRALQEECDGCIEWDEETFSRQAEDQMAKSFFTLKVSAPLMENFEHIAVGAADVGARFGKTAFITKVGAEVAETVLSKMSFMGGLHFFCHLIDAMILFETRRIQVIARSFSWAGVFDRSGLSSLLSSGFVSSVVKRAQKRVRFTVAPVEIDEEALKQVDLEGPNRLWAWLPEGKRAAWVRKLVARAERGDEPSELSLNRKEFLGTRMKRYLLIKSRKRGHGAFMKGKTPMDQALNHDLLWILSVQENILQRSLLPPGEEPTIAAESLAQTYASTADEIRSGLAGEFTAGDPDRRELVEGLLKDIDVIFNPQVPSRIRYFHAATIENLMGGFIYTMFSQVLNEKSEMYGASFPGVWKQFRLRWRVGRYGFYLYELSDFLRLAALQKDPEVLYRYKYESMEALLRVFSYLRQTESLLNAESTEDLKAVERLLSGEYRQLRTFRPWTEKRIARSWLPFRNPRPTCEEMEAAVGQ
jgi:hypothetical protein